MWGLSLALLVTGCGRVAYDAVTSSTDAALDATVDAGDTTPVDAAGDTSADAGVDADAGTTDAAADSGVCGEAPCRLVSPQCGCPTGQMCGWNTSTPRACVLAGTVPVGAVCTRDNECVPGAGCISFGSIGVCHAFCDSAADCPTDARCVRLSWSTPPGICSTTCDPVDQTGCPGATSCGLGLAYEVPSGDVVSVNLCSPPGPGGIDAPCVGPLDCGVALVCNTDHCRPICRVGDPATCTGSCDSFTPPSVVGAVEYGACN